MNTNKRYSLEVRAGAVRLGYEQQGKYPSHWSAICSIAGKMASSVDTIRNCQIGGNLPTVTK